MKDITELLSSEEETIEPILEKLDKEVAYDLLSCSSFLQLGPFYNEKEDILVRLENVCKVFKLSEKDFPADNLQKALDNCINVGFISV
jgi:hypothetical protein